MTTVSFQLPDDVEQHLRRELGDLDAIAKEAALVELYRQGQLSHGKLAEGLGISGSKPTPCSNGITSPRIFCPAKTSISRSAACTSCSAKDRCRKNRPFPLRQSQTQRGLDRARVTCAAMGAGFHGCG